MERIRLRVEGVDLVEERDVLLAPVVDSTGGVALAPRRLLRFGERPHLLEHLGPVPARRRQRPVDGVAIAVGVELGVEKLGDGIEVERFHRQLLPNRCRCQVAPVRWYGTAGTWPTGSHRGGGVAWFVDELDVRG